MIAAVDIYTFFRPYPCRKRVYLRKNKKELAAPPSEYDKLIMTLGQEHEQSQLSKFPDAIKPDYPIGDLSTGAEATRNLILQKVPVIYQGVVCSSDLSISGIPDFLIRKGASYGLCDAKLAIYLKNHPEIPMQLSLYARAFEDTLGTKPADLQVIMGDGTLETIAFVDTTDILQEIRSLQQSRSEPDEAVGWSKCQECCFRDYCWKQAEKKFDPGIVCGVDQGLRNELSSIGVNTYHQLAELPIEFLAELKRPWGKGKRKIGNLQAERIQRQIRSLVSRETIVFSDFELPPLGPCVYFDIESDPHDEGLENKVYLWGVLVDRSDGSTPDYWGEVAGEE
jgi:predicted RecB family nuclease